jgi:hypothetical protein
MMVVEWEAFHPASGGVFGDETALWHHNYFENPAAWEDFSSALERLARYADKRGVCAEVLVHTHLASLDRDHPFEVFYRHVETEARSQGLGVIQSLPAFRGRDSSTLWVGRLDSHPNAEAHEILARALYEGLRELPDSCWRLPDEDDNSVRSKRQSPP